MKLKIVLNDKDVTLSGKDNESLFEVLKRDFGIFKNLCCQKANCGRCHLFLDGKEIPSCLVSLYQVSNREVVTPDSLFDSGEYQNFITFLQEENVVFCHQCTHALIFHVHAYLTQFSELPPQHLSTILAEVPCRCGSRDGFKKSLLQFLNQKKTFL